MLGVKIWFPNSDMRIFYEVVCKNPKRRVNCKAKISSITFSFILRGGNLHFFFFLKMNSNRILKPSVSVSLFLTLVYLFLFYPMFVSSSLPTSLHYFLCILYDGFGGSSAPTAMSQTNLLCGYLYSLRVQGLRIHHNLAGLTHFIDMLVQALFRFLHWTVPVPSWPFRSLLQFLLYLVYFLKSLLHFLLCLLQFYWSILHFLLYLLHFLLSLLHFFLSSSLFVFFSLIS